jgi:hypothetical protein
LVRRRWPRLAVAGTGLSALVSWLLLLDQGPSTARIIAAVATTTGSVISIVRLRKEERSGSEREV